MCGVSADQLLDPLVAGVFAGRIAVRACAVAAELSREEVMWMIDTVIGCRRTA